MKKLTTETMVEKARLVHGDKYCYDFYLPNYNLIIEYQGEQHFRFIEYWHKTYEVFLACQRRDQIKRDWAMNNGINYLEIVHNDLHNIDTILTNTLGAYT